MNTKRECAAKKMYVCAKKACPPKKSFVEKIISLHESMSPADRSASREKMKRKCKRDDENTKKKTRKMLLI